MPLSIILLGAGIAGLTAALALRKQGHHVVILEKSTCLQEAGAAIHLAPNCTGILHRLGLDQPFVIGANLLTGMKQYSENGEMKTNLNFTETNRQWANPWLLIHRQDLHRELNRLALDPTSKGPTPELLLGCVATCMDVHEGIVWLEDGRRFNGDVIIGADGNFSFARTQIQSDIGPYPWGKSCYRWVAQRKELLADVETRDLIGEDGCFTEIAEADRRIVMYPCRNNTEMNFVAEVPNEAAYDADGGIVSHFQTDYGCPRQHGNKAALLEAFEKFCPEAQKLLSNAPEDVRIWRYYDMQTLSPWTRGRLGLIGDAAHPFLPFLGQGVAMAIEDAASMAQLLTEDAAPAEVPERLELYWRIRQERVGWIQEQTRIKGMNKEQTAATNAGFGTMDYCHNHDESENSAQKLKQLMND